MTEHTIRVIEGTACLGKTTLMSRLGERKGRISVSLDFDNFLNGACRERDDIKKIFMSKHNHPVAASFYGMRLGHSLGRVEAMLLEHAAESAATTKPVMHVDRALVSDAVYNLILTHQDLYKTADIFEAFKESWTSQGLTKLLGFMDTNIIHVHGLIAYEVTVIIDSEADGVRMRMVNRDTKLDTILLAMFENYPEVQNLCWAYVAKEMGYKLIDAKGKYVSENLEVLEHYNLIKK